MTGPTGFLGLSHLGLVSGIGWASYGEPVLGIDPDPETIALLGASRLPIHEPGLDELFARVRDGITFTTDPAAAATCPLVFLSRDVPTTEDNRSDLSVVERLVEQVIPHLRRDAVLVVMSQVPPGFTRGVASRARQGRPAGGPRVFYWVETLVLGRAVDRFLRPERIILGCEQPGEPLPDVLEQGIRRFRCPVLPMRFESAELTKTAINLYLASAVTYANTLADLCERIGADWSEVMPALRMDARIGRDAYIRPSLGIAGGNLERDLVTLRSLAADRGVDGAFIATLVAHNAGRIRWVLDRLDALVLSQAAQPTIAVWGLAYKRGTASVKNSAALRVIASLGRRATVRAYDPVVRPSITDPTVTVVSHRDAALAGADCLLIMTDWEEFASIDPLALGRAMRRPLVIDCVGVLEDRRGGLEGIQYVSMGRT